MNNGGGGGPAGNKERVTGVLPRRSDSCSVRTAWLFDCNALLVDVVTWCVTDDGLLQIDEEPMCGGLAVLQG